MVFVETTYGKKSNDNHKNTCRIMLRKRIGSDDLLVKKWSNRISKESVLTRIN